MIIVIKDYEKPQEENAVKIFFEGGQEYSPVV